MSDELVPEYPLYIMQGATRTLTITVQHNNGTAFDLTGYTAKLQIRDKPGGTVISELTSSPAAGLTINAAAGEIVPLWTAAQTAAFVFEKAVYDLPITSATGTVTVLMRGEVPLIMAVTK